MDVLSPPIVNERGERLLAFHSASADPPSPPRFALALLLRQSRVLLVHNTRRDVWELPGGWIDAGESARDCAGRELREETGRRATRLSLRGWLVLDRGPANSEESTGAVFVARARREEQRLPDGEILAAEPWPIDALPSRISAIDAWLVARLAGPENDRGRRGAP